MFTEITHEGFIISVNFSSDNTMTDEYKMEFVKTKLVPAIKKDLVRELNETHDEIGSDVTTHINIVIPKIREHYGALAFVRMTNEYGKNAGSILVTEWEEVQAY